MRKPWWVRGIGILGWVFASIAGLSFYAVVSERGDAATAMGTYFTGMIAAGLFILWGVISFVLYAIGRGVRQNAAILRDALAAGRPFPAGPTPAARARVSGALDQISVNVPHRPVAPVRQTGSVFGLTLGQQPRANDPSRAAASEVRPSSEMAPGPMDVPIRTAGSSGASVPPERSAGSTGEARGGKGEPAVYTYEAPGLPLCPECGKRPVIFYCRSHLKALCLECVVRHDRALECVYVPGWRGEKSEAH